MNNEEKHTTIPSADSHKKTVAFKLDSKDNIAISNNSLSSFTKNSKHLESALDDLCMDVSSI